MTSVRRCHDRRNRVRRRVEGRAGPGGSGTGCVPGCGTVSVPCAQSVCASSPTARTAGVRRRSRHGSGGSGVLNTVVRKRRSRRGPTAGRSGAADAGRVADGTERCPRGTVHGSERERRAEVVEGAIGRRLRLPARLRKLTRCEVCAPVRVVSRGTMAPTARTPRGPAPASECSGGGRHGPRGSHSGAHVVGRHSSGGMYVCGRHVRGGWTRSGRRSRRSARRLVRLLWRGLVPAPTCRARL